MYIIIIKRPILRASRNIRRLLNRPSSRLLNNKIIKNEHLTDAKN